MIQLEGVESLSEAELRQACRERGLLGLLSVEEMRQQVLFSCLMSFVLNELPFFSIIIVKSLIELKVN